MAKFLNLLKLRGFTSPSDAAVDIATTTDGASASRLRIDAGGKLTWGDGALAGDTNLYRSIANTLKTDDYLVAEGGLTVESYQVTTVGASAGNALVFDGTKFAPSVVSGGGAAGSTYVANIGNGASTTFTVTHGLNTRDVFVQARNAASPYEVIDVQWEATSTSTVTFNFSTPPDSNSVRVAIYSAVTGDNVLIPLDNLTDVAITAPEEFQSLTYNGASWVNSFAPTVTYVRNAEATTLTTGTVVYLFGATGDHATVKRASNTSDATSSKTIGLVAAPINASENGPVVTRGYVDGIDLSVGYTAGDVLWLGTNGQFTTTKTAAPDHLVFVGVVVRATNNGIIYVATQNGYELDELHNVSIPSLNTGDVLTYNGSLWTAASVSSFSVTTSDTAPSSPSTGDMWYDSTSGATFIYYDSAWIEIGGAGSLADGSVTTAKLDDQSVTAAKIADGAVTSAKILDGTIATADIANNAITQAKISTDVPLSGMRNVLINGDFRIWQRGTSDFAITGTPPYYTVDRWQTTRASGASAGTVSRQSTGLDGFEYCVRFQRNLNNNVTNAMLMAQSIETTNVRPLHGKFVTLSFWARAGSNFSSSGSILTSSMISGTGTDSNILNTGFTAQGTHTSQSNVLTTSWQRFTMTTSAALANTVTQFGVQFSYTPVGTASTNDYFEITGVQLESGAQATPFEQRPYGVELTLCQRYYEKNSNIGDTVGNSMGLTGYMVSCWYLDGWPARLAIPFKVNKRNSPGVTLYGPSGQNSGWWVYGHNSTQYAARGTSVVVATESYFQISVSTWNGSSGTLQFSQGLSYLAEGAWAASSEL